GSRHLQADVQAGVVSWRPWLPSMISAVVLLVLSAIVAAPPALPQTQSAGALDVTCALDANGNAVFTLESSASPGTTITGTYSVIPDGPTDAPFSLIGLSSLGITGPAGSSLTATVINSDGTTTSISGSCAPPPPTDAPTLTNTRVPPAITPMPAG